MSELELKHGIVFPAEVYPLFENAYPRRTRLTLAAHRAELAEMSGASRASRRTTRTPGSATARAARRSPPSATTIA
jgi:hypothetical protein